MAEQAPRDCSLSHPAYDHGHVYERGRLDMNLTLFVDAQCALLCTAEGSDIIHTEEKASAEHSAALNAHVMHAASNMKVDHTVP